MCSVWESNDNHGIGHIQDIPTRATPKAFSPVVAYTALQTSFTSLNAGFELSGRQGVLLRTDLTAGIYFALASCMERKKTNQERGRKYSGSSSFVEVGQPSKAPRQDEDGKEAVGSMNRKFGPADGESPRQGISNRPAKDEHAFADSDQSGSPPDAPESVEDGPKQVGGNRGRV